MNKTIAWRLTDLEHERNLANLKLQEIHDFDAQNLNGVHQNEALDKEIEIRTQSVIISLKTSLAAMTIDLEGLKEKKKGLSNVLDAREVELDSLEEAVKESKINQEKEIKDLEENHAKNTQEFLNEIEREMNRFSHDYTKREAEIGERNKRLKQDINIIKTEHAEIESDLRECEDKYFKSYIWQVCLDLQANMYHVVLPDKFNRKHPYKVKDIEEDIDDEELLDDEEREEAGKRWEDLKGKLSWKPSLERTLKMLQEDGNPCMARPECLTVEEAGRVAEELNKRGKLKGRTSYEKVKQIIEMWKESITLVQSLQ